MEKKKTFRTCTLTFLEKTFGLDEVQAPLPSLKNWMDRAALQELPAMKEAQLKELQHLLQFNVKSWNEQELDMHFIGPVFSMLHFSSKQFNLFAERPIAGKIGEWELYGEPDGIIASGRREPEIPFFAFSEYKRQTDPKGEPAAQTLAAMLVGQSLNKANQPMYGCYVIGHDWYFMTLEGVEYGISRDYSALSNEIFDIFKLLKTLKGIVQERVSIDFKG